MYCLYAWGVPLALTAMMLTMQYADFSDKPWIIQPLINYRNTGCFLEDGQKFVYLYVPMLILIICNWVFFLLTVFNIWRVSRATAVVRSPASGNAAAHRAHKLRFILYIKLSVIMGVNWLLEIVSSFYPELSGWWVTDLYNLLVGFFIFIIFIFRSKIYKDLQAKYALLSSLFFSYKTREFWATGVTVHFKTERRPMCTKMILFVITLTLWPLGLTGNVTDSSSPVDYVDKSKSDVICANKTCVNRCCSQGEYLKCGFDENPFCHCEPSNSSVDKHDQMFANEQLYSNKFYGEKVDTTFAKAFVLVPSFYPNASDEFKTTAAVINLETQSRAYLGMDGKIQVESPNAYKRWDVYDADKFCVDIVKDKVDYVVNMTPLVPENKAYVYPMLVSSFFLMLVLVVYAVLPDLRNLPGKILMAYVTSQIIAFISLAIMQLFNDLSDNSCIILTSIVYDNFLSSFCWMNVMSYDIFWTFRSYAKARVHRTGENFKFAMYCLYAWGVPLALTAMMLTMQYADFSDKPWIIQPLLIETGCFLVDGQKFVYLYVPMLILIICNWVFFLLTVFNIWRVSRATAVVRSPASGNAAAHRAHKLRFILYIKLSVIMGVNWLLEVVSSFYPELSGWWVTDLYNLLVGFFIFIIFIFRRKIYKDLQAKFSSIRLDQWSTTNSANNSTSESNLSQDQQVSKHPRHFGGLRSR